MVASLEKDPPLLFTCVPAYWSKIPRFLRSFLAWTTISLFGLSFLSAPCCMLLLFPPLWSHAPVILILFTVAVFMSLILPLREWPWVRKVGQLWYEEFQFSTNLSEAMKDSLVRNSESSQFIISMHPHGIIPIHAILWTAFCDQFLTLPSGSSVYGFGAAADAVFYAPFLRNILGWLTAGSAAYGTLKRGLTTGEISVAPGRKPRHLFILPGGVAEVFTSTPGTNIIVFKGRKGLLRLSLETGAHLLPTFVFGVTDLYRHVPVLSGVRSYLSRRFRMGFAPFYGQCGLPVPFARRLTMVFGEPIAVTRWEGEGPVPAEALEDLHAKYLGAMEELFNKYKAVAGYPDATLEIR